MAAAENVAVRQEREHRLCRVEMMRIDVHGVVGSRSDAAAAEVLGVAIEPGGLGVVARRVFGVEGVVRQRGIDVQQQVWLERRAELADEVMRIVALEHVRFVTARSAGSPLLFSTPPLLMEMSVA